MAEETLGSSERMESRKRRVGHSKSKGGKAKKKFKTARHSGEKKVKIDKRMKQLFRKRAREYNSDDEEEEEDAPAAADESSGAADVASLKDNDEAVVERNYLKGEENWNSEDEAEDIQPGIAKFAEGCRAFRVAFKKIIQMNVSDDLLGPVLSGHKKLIIQKLAEEEIDQKVSGKTKKERQLVKEKGHVKPADFLDSHEKFLISVATKGVVKLFNAVNKAQRTQKRLNPSKSKYVKEMRKQKKQAFFSELGRPSSQMNSISSKEHTSKFIAGNEGPSWAPLRDNYMLTNSKLKDWDKKQDAAVADGIGSMPVDSSSDGDD